MPKGHLRETPIPFTPYLRKIGTNEIYAYSKGIAMRTDMEPYLEDVIPKKDGLSFDDIIKQPTISVDEVKNESISKDGMLEDDKDIIRGAYNKNKKAGK